MSSAMPNSFRDDYLERLPPWDGAPRVDTLLQTAFDLHLPTGRERADGEWASRTVLIGAVARSYEPGIQAHKMVVLVGPAGCGKSNFCRHLVPSLGGGQSGWFSDELVLRSSDGQVLMGRVIMECAEMACMTRSDADAAKAFISRLVDRVRLPYERVAQEFPRQFIIIGTSNAEPALLGDPGGARRLLPVRITGRGERSVTELLDETRDQLWAEAVHRHKMGERPESGESAGVAA